MVNKFSVGPSGARVSRLLIWSGKAFAHGASDPRSATTCRSFGFSTRIAKLPRFADIQARELLPPPVERGLGTPGL